MASYTRTVLDNVLKYMYEKDVVRSVFEENTVLWDYIKPKTKAMPIGRSFLCPVRESRSVGTYGRSEEGTLPTATTPGYDQLTITYRYLYHPLSITGQSFESTKSSEAAFIRVVTEAVGEGMKSMAREGSRQLWGMPTGQLCLVNGAVSSSTTITLDTPGSIYLDAGMLLDVGTAAELGGTGSPVDVTISSVDSDTQITASAAVTLEDNDLVVKDGQYNICVNGLNAIFCDGTNSLHGTSSTTTSIYGLTRSSNTWTYPHIFTSAGNSVTINLLKATSRIRANQGTARIGLTHPYVFNSLYYTVKSLTRYNIPDGGLPQTFHAGHRSFDFNGVPIVEDPFCPRSSTTGSLVFLDTDWIDCYWTGPPGFPSEHAQWTPSSSADSVFGRLRLYWTGLVCHKFINQAAVTGITIDNVSAV